MRRILIFSLLTIAGSLPSLAEIDSGLLALVPSDAKLITSVDVTQAKTSPFGQYIMNKINTEDQSFKELIRETGFDPRRDVQNFVFASSGPKADDAPGKFALLVRGTFDQERIKATAKTKGATVQEYQGIDVLLGPSNDRQNAFAFLESGIALLGDLATVQGIIANRAKPTTLDPSVQQLIFKAGENDAWFVSLMPGSYLVKHVTEQTKTPEQAEALQSILQSSGGIRFGEIVQLSFEAIARSAKDATSLADVVRFLGSMIQMQRQQDQRAGILASAVDRMTLETQGDEVHLSLSMPEKNLEQLADLAPGPAHHAR